MRPLILRLLGVLALAAALLGLAWLAGGDERPWLGVPTLAWCAALSLGINLVAFLPAWLQRNERFYDLTGSLTYLSVVTLAVASVEEPGGREVLALGCVVVWALRLGGMLARRVRAAGKDGRFDAIKQSFSRFLVAWTLQAVWVWLTCLAVLLLITGGSRQAGLAITDLGFGLWGLGFAIEVVADRQKAAFRRRGTGTWIDEGLWSWSRHPNYFGEILLWAGLFVVASGHLVGWGWLAALSPVFVWLLLTRVSGVPLLEERADARWGGDPAYEAYKERTPVLWPRPPRHG